LKNSFLLILLVIFSCGKALALPQDWLCEEILVKKVKELQHDDVSYRNLYYGKNQYYSLSLELEGSYKYPNAVISCGTAGCYGTITNLQTNVSENMRFDCFFTKDKDVFSCHRIDNDEYLLTLSKPDTYTVQLCNSYNLYVNIQECDQCKCIIHDSRGNKGSSDRQLNCYRENESQIRCFSYFGYEKWRNFENKENDFDKCVGLKL